MKYIIATILVTVTLVNCAPQWPYRDNMESYYYGYQDTKPNNKNYYRAEILDDDESEAEYSPRQDLKVGQSSQSDTSAPVTKEPNVEVIETGSAKPVPSKTTQPKPISNTQTNNQQGQQPFASPNGQRQPPAFPPAQPPRPNAQNRPGQNPNEESEEDEEDSDEEEEADENEEDEEENDDDDEDSDKRRRNEPVVNVTEKPSNVTVESVEESVESMETPKNMTKQVTKSENNKKVENNKPKKSKGKQTIEALVPGYITDQGEVLVPFDTVSGNLNNRPGGQISIIPDPSYEDSTLQVRAKKVTKKQPKKKTGGTPPVVVVGNKKVELEQRSVPQFFRSSSGQSQVYYSSAPPPGSIFTFDDDNEEVAQGGKLRQDDQSSEEEEEDDQDDDNVSDDETESEEEDIGEAPPRPPLGFVKATAPSGEDDEAESLGLRPGTPIQSRSLYDEQYVSFPTSRSPSVFAVQIPFNPAYFQYNKRPTQEQYHYSERPHYQNYGRPHYVQQRPSYSRPQQSYYKESRPQQGYYGNKDSYYNREQSYYGNKNNNQVYYYRPESSKKTKVIPVANFDVSLEHDEESGEVKPVLSPFYYKDVKIAKKNRPVVVRRPVRPSRPQNRPNLVAVYDGENGYSFTPVIRQRNGFQRLRMAKQLKESKKSNKKVVKKVDTDPLGFFKKDKVKKN